MPGVGCQQDYPPKSDFELRTSDIVHQSITTLLNSIASITTGKYI